MQRRRVLSSLGACLGASTLAGVAGSAVGEHRVAVAAIGAMSLTAFAVLVVINRTDSADDFKAFNGLHQRSPFLAFAITVHRRSSSQS